MPATISINRPSGLGSIQILNLSSRIWTKPTKKLPLRLSVFSEAGGEKHSRTYPSRSIRSPIIVSISLVFSK